ncbi:uncharacterized protein [Lolium perenne]|uniref:uncharacterized protein isoform X1 n=1 Tax=Lolium perenne TaxID=4522 RepID=UPI0021F55032|nr:uncharacterized protein LOC127326691 [Lolium perenne]
MAADWEGIHPRELRQMEEIRELDMEELNVETEEEGGGDEEEEEEEDDEEEEEVDYSRLLAVHSFRRLDRRNGRAIRSSHDASLHGYLGEVEDTPGRKVALLDAGAILSLPMLFLHGVVLFPEANLPLRLIETRLVASVEKALRHVDAPNTIGVVLMYRRPNRRYYSGASVGTTAEIRQLGRLDDGSVNVKARGQQRFRLIRHWQDVDGVVWGEVQIIEEDAPLRTPRDAFAQLAASSSFQPHTSSPVTNLDVSLSEQQDHMDSDVDCDSSSLKSTASDHSMVDTKIYHSSSQSSNSMKFCISSQSGKNTDMDEEDYVCSTPPSSARKTDTKQQHQYNAARYRKQPCQASLSFWPQWTYEMYDSYALARRAADLWRLIIKKQIMDDYVTKPDLLSFYIGSQLPVSEPLRQKLLEIDGISYRLRREIQLLNACDIIKCRYCKSEIAKRSDVVAMSSDGPLGTYVNPHGFVHATITVNNATGLALEGSPSKVHSWFPGYAWTIASCAECGSNIGWLFSTTKKHLQPKSFWGIRSSQIADIVEEEQGKE